MKKISWVQLMMCISSLLIGQDNVLLYRSTDGGNSWSSSAKGLPTADRVDVILQDGEMIYALTESSGLYRSKDQGMSWYQPGFAMLLPPKIDALHKHNGLLFAGTYKNGVYVSTDQGNNWLPANKGLTDSTVRAFGSVGKMLLVGTNDGLFFSVNNGQQWRQLSSGMQINAIKAIGESIFVATHRGIMVSKDGGEQWTWSKEGMAIQELAAAGDWLYATTFGRSVFKYQVEKGTWVDATETFPKEGFYTRILYSSREAQFVTQDQGLLVSTDKGKTWRALDQGLGETTVFRDLKSVGPNLMLLGSGTKKHINE